MKRKSIMRSLAAQGEGWRHSSNALRLPLRAHAGPARGRSESHARTLPHARAHTCSLLSKTNILQMADSIICSTWVRRNVYKSISLTPNLLPPLPHKPHSKVIQRATEVRFCICFIFYFGREKRHSMVFWHVLQTSSVSAEVTLPPTSSLGPVYSTSRAKFMEKSDGYKFEVSISYL